MVDNNPTRLTTIYTLSDPETGEVRYVGKTIKTFSPEVRAKRSAFQRRKKISSETRAKISASHQGVPLSDTHYASVCIANRKRRYGTSPDQLELEL